MTQLIRLGVVAGVLLASVLLPSRIALGHRLPSLVFLAYLGVPATVYLLRFPYVGIAALIAAGLVVPFTVGTGSQTGINISLLLLGGLIGLWVLEWLVQRRVSFYPARPIKPLLVFVGLAIVSYGFGKLNWLPITGASELAQIAGLAVFVLSAGAFLLVAHQLRRQYMLERLTWVFLALGGVYLMGRVVPQVERFTSAHFLQPAVAGSMFWTWFVALAFSQAIFNRKLARAWRLALALLVIGAFYVSLGQALGWTSGWLPPVVAVAVTIFAANPKRRLPLLLCAGVILLITQRQVLTDVVFVGDNAYSLSTRAEAASVLFGIFKLSPLFGLGPANYYWYASLFPISGYYVPFNSHNNYVDLALQVGLLGLACFLWFAVELWRLGWRIRRHVPEGFATAYVYGALGGLAGTLVAGALGDWVLPFIYNIGLDGFRASVLAWVFLGGLIVLQHNSEPSGGAVTAKPSNQ